METKLNAMALMHASLTNFSYSLGDAFDEGIDEVVQEAVFNVSADSLSHVRVAGGGKTHPPCGVLACPSSQRSAPIPQGHNPLPYHHKRRK